VLAVGVLAWVECEASLFIRYIRDIRYSFE